MTDPNQNQPPQNPGNWNPNSGGWNQNPYGSQPPLYGQPGQPGQAPMSGAGVSPRTAQWVTGEVSVMP